VKSPSPNNRRLTEHGILTAITNSSIYGDDFLLTLAFHVVCIDPCTTDQFHCSRGTTCISAEQECDGVTHCNDTSDEAKCCKLLYTYMQAGFYRGKYWGEGQCPFKPTRRRRENRVAEGSEWDWIYRGVVPLQPTRGSGERRELPQRVRGPKRIVAHFEAYRTLFCTYMIMF